MNAKFQFENCVLQTGLYLSTLDNCRVQFLNLFFSLHSYVLIFLTLLFPNRILMDTAIPITLQQQAVLTQCLLSVVLTQISMVIFCTAENEKSVDISSTVAFMNFMIGILIFSFFYMLYIDAYCSTVESVIVFWYPILYIS